MERRLAELYLKMDNTDIDVSEMLGMDDTDTDYNEWHEIGAAMKDWAEAEKKSSCETIIDSIYVMRLFFMLADIGIARQIPPAD